MTLRAQAGIQDVRLFQLPFDGICRADFQAQPAAVAALRQDRQLVQTFAHAGLTVLIVDVSFIFGKEQ